MVGWALPGRWKAMKTNMYWVIAPTDFIFPAFKISTATNDLTLAVLVIKGAGRAGWSHEVAELRIGGDFKDALCEPGQWSIGLGGFGETLPYHDNKITLDKEKKDKWGLPVLAFDCEIKDNEKKMRIDMMNDAKEMLEKAGVKKAKGNDQGYSMGMAIHEMGTARMGRDAKTSVLNGNNQVWDAPNVFVTDGACMTSAACVNPSLTYMALTARAADFAVRELKHGNLA